ncbi:hypothetical protein BRN92_20985 [Xanthomonas oryzae pv. oryzae]|nr:hypothetical protein ACU13_01620 [Xanthomonas oryzae pv. oryzicola]OLH06701.1 hypothetical protein BXO589_03910 [Xanthomonas oryzae pv. oryzae]AKN95692.1 hypothetical protein ACU10_01620 [Xanthomonas oryzae pv. oryzicola]AKO14647.1 hypothetical protein ACU12_01610 [Xanthomonas oryzae pv. oryzicola]OLH24535.1 hypothetical protein BXO590_06950 [Xanthomonas oryzae pv. oryzae]
MRSWRKTDGPARGDLWRVAGAVSELCRLQFFRAMQWGAEVEDHGKGWKSSPGSGNNVQVTGLALRFQALARTRLS